jgi:hypothetical protein
LAIEVVRAGLGTGLVADPGQLVAVATDTHLNISLPQLDLNDSIQIADFVEVTFLKNEPPVD